MFPKIDLIKEMRELGKKAGVNVLPTEDGEYVVTTNYIGLKEAKDFVEKVYAAAQGDCKKDLYDYNVQEILSHLQQRFGS